MSDARPYDLVTFDCYGTLIDWEGGIREAFSYATAQKGIAVDGGAVVEAYMRLEPTIESEAYRSYRETLVQVAWRVATSLGWAITAEQAAFLPDSLPGWKPFPDTNAALERLKTAGYKLGILSNVDDALLAATRRHFTVDFDLIVTAEMVQSYKPAHGHFTKAREQMAAGTRWLHAAQSYFHDVIPARALGIPTAWVNRKAETASDGGKADLEVATMTELADLLAGARKS